MKAKAGDRVVVDRHRPGDVKRHGEILEVRGEKEAPRYLVRWSNGRESIFVPRAPRRPSSPATRDGSVGPGAGTHLGAER